MRVAKSSRWGDNVTRLAGLHGLSSGELAQALGMSDQIISMWRHGKREPGGKAFIAVGTLFGIDPVLLTQRTFEELLPLAADRDRFLATEAKLSQGTILPHRRIRAT